MEIGPEENHPPRRSMEADSPPPESSLKDKADALQKLVSGPLAAATARLSGHSRGIPTGKDFHFYNNFDEFKDPAREIAACLAYENEPARHYFLPLSLSHPVPLHSKNSRPRATLSIRPLSCTLPPSR